MSITIQRFEHPTALGPSATSIAAQAWAVSCINRVCNARMSIVASNNATIRFFPRNSNDVAGRTQENRVEISTVRKFGRIETLGGVIVHEICHTWGFSFAPNMGHTPNTTAYLDRIMHPWVANDSWWHPAEVVSLQRKYGLPTTPFRAWEVDYLAAATSTAHQQYMRTRSQADLNTANAMRSLRDAKARLWMEVPMFNRAAYPWLPSAMQVAPVEFDTIPEANPTGPYECQCFAGAA